MPRERSVRGRLVAAENTVEYRLTTVATRPWKMAFVIHNGSAPSHILKFIHYNTSVWGGYYNLLVPLDGRSLDEDWWTSLARYDPDAVIVNAGIEDVLIDELQARLPSFITWRWHDDVLEQLNESRDLLGGIVIDYALDHFYRTNRPLETTNIRLLTLPEGNPFALYAAAQFGQLSERLHRICLDVLHGQEFRLDTDDLASYLNIVSELRTKSTPIRLSRWHLTSSGGAGLQIPTIVLADDQSIADICLFWNLRMQPRLMNVEPIIVPFAALRSERNLAAFAAWCKATMIGKNRIVLASTSISKQRMLRLKARLKPLIRPPVEFVDVRYADFRTGQFRVHESETRQEIRIDGHDFRIRTPFPAFAEDPHGSWVVDVDFSEPGQQLNGFLPPQHKDLNHLLSGEPDELQLQVGGGYSVRLAGKYVSFRATRRQEYLAGRLLSNERVFTSLLRSRAYQVTLTDKCRYTQSVIKLAGGLQELSIWRDVKVRALFDQLREGSSYTPTEMLRPLEPGNQQRAREQAHSMFTALAEKGVLLRGFKIQCPACDITHWYPTTAVTERMLCAGCLTTLQPPLEAPFRYRLNDLVLRAIDQGAVPVVLTMLFLEALTKTSFMALPGLEVRKKSAIDLDIVAACDGKLVLAECKDLRKGTSNRAIEAVADQFSTLVMTALDINADIVLLSILATEVPQQLARRLTALQRKVGRQIGVHLLSATDLERGYRTKPSGAFLNPDEPEREVPSTLDDYLAGLTRRKGGWVEERGATRISF